VKISWICLAVVARFSSRSDFTAIRVNATTKDITAAINIVEIASTTIISVKVKPHVGCDSRLSARCGLLKEFMALINKS
jgi:hypothetical protein